MNKEIFDRLNELNIEYNLVEHPEGATMNELAEFDLESYGHIPKNLVLRDARGKRNMLVLVCGDKRADLQLIRDEIGSTKLSFASDQRLEKFLSVEKGSVSPFGLIYDKDEDLEVYFDGDLQKKEIVGCHPNDNHATVFLKFSDLNKFIESTGHKIRFIEV